MKMQSKKQNTENNKTKVAEILFNSNAPTEIIMWALSHLPDSNIKGKKKATVFNHEANKMSEAVGISERKWSIYSKKILILVDKILVNKLKVSMAVQQVFDEYENDLEFRKWVLSNMICIFTDKVQEDFMKSQVLKEITKSLKNKKK